MDAVLAVALIPWQTVTEWSARWTAWVLYGQPWWTD